MRDESRELIEDAVKVIWNNPKLTVIGDVLVAVFNMGYAEGRLDFALELKERGVENE